MSDVFLDTVGILAVLNHSDQWRTPALKAFESLTAARRSFITTTLVLCEAGNALARTSLRAAIADMRAELETEGKVVSPTDDEFAQAWQFYRQGSAGAASIVDCVSFIVMRRYGLTEAFTNDQHFQAAGFTPLF